MECEGQEGIIAVEFHNSICEVRKNGQHLQGVNLI